MTPLAKRVLAILARVTSTRDLDAEMDTDLFEAGLLDSLALVNLILTFDDELGVPIYPSELDRETWSTPRKLIADIERRKAAAV